MNAPALLDRLHTLGVAVRVAGDKLELEPGSLVPESMVEEIRAVKPEIIALIEASGLMTLSEGGLKDSPPLPDRVQLLVGRFVEGQAYLSLVRDELAGSPTMAVGTDRERRYVEYLSLLAGMEANLRAQFGFEGCARGKLGPCDPMAVLRCEACAATAPALEGNAA